ncbi:MAG: DUF1640 domain-containing protein [Chromatiaceae bacterium]|nr:DUF1640 domain-containing protein [Chromatiaceae bacterium]
MGTVVETYEALDERHPHLPALVVQQDPRVTESQLLKEFGLFRSEFKTQIGLVRRDIREAELRLRKEIEQLRGEVRTAIERSRNTLLMWLIPLMFAQVGAMAALVKLL